MGTTGGLKGKIMMEFIERLFSSTVFTNVLLMCVMYGIYCVLREMGNLGSALIKSVSDIQNTVEMAADKRITRP